MNMLQSISVYLIHFPDNIRCFYQLEAITHLLTGQVIISPNVYIQKFIHLKTDIRRDISKFFYKLMVENTDFQKSTYETDIRKHNSKYNGGQKLLLAI